MERRKFIKGTIAAASALYIFKDLYANPITNMFPAEKDHTADLVKVIGGEPGEMFDKGIEEFGGIERFVKQGQKVLVKPNIGWDATLERAGNTNPDLVGHIVKKCYSAGAKEVVVFDNSVNNNARCYKNSGIEKAVLDAGGKMIDAKIKSDYRRVRIKNGVSLKKVRVHSLVLDTDVFINVPILKHHGATRFTGSMKNLMGTVWNRISWHMSNLHQCIADYSTFCKPTLNVLDAYRVLKKHGPRGGITADDVELNKTLAFTTDTLIMDIYAAEMFGLLPHEIKHLKLHPDFDQVYLNMKNLKIKEVVL